MLSHPTHRTGRFVSSRSKPNPPGAGRRSGYLNMAGHLAVMLVLMYAGMVVLDPLYGVVAGAFGVSDPWRRLPVLSNVMMAVNMTIPMVLYMLHKGHGRRALGEMSAAMFLPAALTMGPFSIGAMTTGTMMTLSHAAMILLMAGAAALGFRRQAFRNHHTGEDAGKVLQPGSAASADASP
jgi:hypothetical protein